jgi:hypothetical protein
MEMPIDQPHGNGRMANARPITSAQLARPVQHGPCRAVLPPGWQLQPGQDGQTATIAGPNGAAAAWGILGVNPAMQRNYGDLFGPPEAHAGAIVAQMLRARPQFTSSENINGFYTLHQFQAGYNAGVILYHVFPSPVQGQYIITDYFAWAPANNPELLSQAEAIMTSLSCTSQLHPQGPNHFEPTSGFSGHKRSGNAESDSLKDYNSTLGTQYAHDSAGRNYFLDRASMWSYIGPSGPGYYVGEGVNRVKLTEGLQ